MAFGGTGALFKTTDTGTTWTAIVTGSVADFGPVYDVNVPVSGAGNVIDVLDGDAFVRSADGGVTWQSSLLPGSGHGMAVSPFNRANVLVAVPGKGVAHSTDGGATWSLLAGSPVIGSTTSIGVLHAPIVADLSTDGTYYLGTDQGLFVTTNSGVTWTKSTAGFAVGDVAIRDIGTSAASTTTVYALAGIDSSSVSNLYVSSDHGKTWSSLAISLDAERVVPDGVSAKTIWLSGLTLHAVYQSSDAGATFAPSDTGMPQGAPSSSFIVNGPTGTFLPNVGTSFFAATQGFGVFRSQDGAATWTLSSSGISSW